MRPVTIITGTMVPLERGDVDTDQIIPQQFLKRVERDGYGEFLFHSWARHEDGTPRADFILNDPLRRRARILVTGPNFGCGSSREHAVWALQGWGFEAVLAESMADIFRTNAANNGLLAVELPGTLIQSLIAAASDPEAEITVDLESQTISRGNETHSFSFDSNTRQRLLMGLDQIGVTLGHDDAIAGYENSRDGWLPSL